MPYIPYIRHICHIYAQQQQQQHRVLFPDPWDFPWVLYQKYLTKFAGTEAVWSHSHDIRVTSQDQWHSNQASGQHLLSFSLRTQPPLKTYGATSQARKVKFPDPALLSTIAGAVSAERKASFNTSFPLISSLPDWTNIFENSKQKDSPFRLIWQGSGLIDVLSCFWLDKTTVVCC